MSWLRHPVTKQPRIGSSREVTITRPMETEIETTLKSNSKFKLQLKDSQEKLSATELLLSSERQKNRNNEVLMQRLHTDLENAVHSIQDPSKLKEIVAALHRRFSRQLPIGAADCVDRGGGEDFDRQRDHLERTVERLRLQVRKQTETKSGARDRTIKENIVLLEEINNLRKELKTTREKLGCLESLVGEYLKKQGRSSSRKDIKDYIAIALTEQEAIREKYEEKLESSEKKIALLNDEIKRLSAKLEKLEMKPPQDESTSSHKRTVKLKLPCVKTED